MLALARRFRNQRFLVVHRLDRGTSGVILFARNEAAHRQANLWFSTHTVTKEYLALAAGNPRLPAFRINHPIEGKPALSQLQIAERFESSAGHAFLAKVRIATGRRHQIRIHLQAEGFPILGDTQYGGGANFGDVSFRRFALHAERLVLPGENGRDAVEIRAPLPEDFSGWLSQLRPKEFGRA